MEYYRRGKQSGVFRPIAVRIVTLLSVALYFGAFCDRGALRAQSMNAAISGTVTDPSGAAVPDVDLTLSMSDSGTSARFLTGTDGLFRFSNLHQGTYQLHASAKGFRDFVQTGIVLNLNESVRVDVKLTIGAAVQTVEVSANASPLNFENAEVKGVVTPRTIDALPLIVGGNLRSVSSFAVLQPGVVTAGGAPDDARLNGGIHYGDEGVVDGISIQDGANGQSGMDEMLYDHPLSPEGMSEVSLLTSNYQPQYGATTSSVLTVVTKSGTNEFHGTGYEYLRNTSLNARQFGVPDRPKDIEHLFGGSVGGPLNFIPGLRHLTWTGRKKTYFFANYEGFRIRGGAVAPVFSLPSAKERQGDFTDWLDPNTGNLIPVYDPATTRVNPSFNSNQPVGPTNLPYLRDQFMGCNGSTPNVICPSDPRLQNSLAKQWFQFLPAPTFSGPLNNYVVPVPVPQSTNGEGTLIDVRIDHSVGDKDQFFGTVHYHGSWTPQIFQLPKQITFEEPYGINYMFLDRFNWDHTINPRLLNHFAFGYNDIWVLLHCTDLPYAGQLPQIAGVASHEFPPVLGFEDFQGLGCSDKAKNARPAYIANDQLTWVRGKHTLKFGGEYRALEVNNAEPNNQSGTFNFTRLNTGLLGITSGNAIASFLLGQVDNATVDFQPVPDSYPREKYVSAHFGDTWKLTPKLSLDYGLRWDVSTPSSEKYDRMSFFDPLGPNPGAGNLLGRLAFAGTKWGAASFGRRTPEKIWHRAFAPRLGIAYSFNQKTVVRAGYGVFFQQVYYPHWNGGIPGSALEGFNASPAFSSTLGGLQAAFLLDQGFPQNFTHPPIIDSSAANGQSNINYRPFDANRLAYSQQWNLTVEHQFTNNFYISTAYVGNKGTRLLSNQVPLNALDPKYLSMGQQLFDQFQPGQTSLDGVPVPYSNWVTQMTACASYVAQALLPYPEYCSSLTGQNENAGSSIYHSFQFKAEKRYSQGVWLLASYTFSKLLTTTDDVQTESQVWGGAQGAVVSPFQRERNKALSTGDVPNTLSVALVYQLPVGREKRFLNRGGVIDKVLGGWQASSIFRISSGTPIWFRSSTCNVPSQFQASCIPGLLPGAKPFAQSKGSFDPSQPLFNAAAFESPNDFNFYLGQGPRVSNIRGFGYHNQDFSLIKETRINEKVSLQFRAEFFNVWNWHNFICQIFCTGVLAFSNDVSSPAFGTWNGSVSTPRNIQMGAKILF